MGGLCRPGQGGAVVRGASLAVTAAAVVACLWLSGGVSAAEGRTQALAPASGRVHREVAASRWGKAVEVAGNLNKVGYAQVTSISCAAPGYCAAGGLYDASKRSTVNGSRRFSQAFVVSEVNFTWKQADEVDYGTRNAGKLATVTSVSCAARTSCTAVGTFKNGAHHLQPFITSEQSDGTWSAIQEVTGLPSSADDNTELVTVSCATAGNCTAGGSYTTSKGSFYAFAVTETAGTWAKAVIFPAFKNLDPKERGEAQILSVSCASAGNCTAGGFYTKGFVDQAFVVSQADGTWGTPVPVPEPAGMTEAPTMRIKEVSCTAPGYCTAGGNINGDSEAFAITETKGAWDSTVKVLGEDSYLASLSCATAGNCAAVGSVSSDAKAAFVADQVAGVWSTGTVAAPNNGQNPFLGAVSCQSKGNCTAGGQYGPKDNRQPFVIGERNGTWGTAELIPAFTDLNTGNQAAILEVSCTESHDVGYCAAAGYYTDGDGHTQGFVAEEKSPAPKSLPKSRASSPRQIEPDVRGTMKVLITMSNLCRV
jgi:hypothetical protein